MSVADATTSQNPSRSAAPGKDAPQADDGDAVHVFHGVGLPRVGSVLGRNDPESAVWYPRRVARERQFTRHVWVGQKPSGGEEL